MRALNVLIMKNEFTSIKRKKVKSEKNCWCLSAVCVENAGHEMNGYFCSPVTFLTGLSVSTLLKLKLHSSEHTINNAKSGMGCLERFELWKLW